MKSIFNSLFTQRNVDGHLKKSTEVPRRANKKKLKTYRIYKKDKHTINISVLRNFVKIGKALKKNIMNFNTKEMTNIITKQKAKSSKTTVEDSNQEYS